MQAIQPRVVEQKTTKGIESLQKQLTTNPSFTPRVVCPPFVQNALKYPMESPANSHYQATYGIPVLSPIQQLYPLHQSVLLNPYLPPMQSTFLKQFPTIDEVSETERKFASLNTRAHKNPPKFQSMRIVKKRNIERFYPNTEYGENFNEINNNKNSSESEKENDDIIYQNYPSVLKIRSNISGIENFENLTDSIQVCEEVDRTISTNSLNRPVPAPRTKISPYTSPNKSDHVYVNLSMPLINIKGLRSFDTVDAPVRSTKSAEDISKMYNHKALTKVEVKDTEDDEDNYNEGKNEVLKPNIIGATPKKNLSVILPSSSLVKSVVDQLNDQGINKVGLPKKQAITPNKTLQIPKLSEKPVPKRSIVRRSNSVQTKMPLDNENGQVYNAY